MGTHSGPSNTKVYEPRTSIHCKHGTHEEQVPFGIVGTRIRQLGNIADPEGPVPGSEMADTVVPRERESTSLGWGRRAEQRFAKPASRNLLLGEQSNPQQVDHAYHNHSEPMEPQAAPDVEMQEEVRGEYLQPPQKQSGNNARFVGSASQSNQPNQSRTDDSKEYRSHHASRPTSDRRQQEGVQTSSISRYESLYAPPDGHAPAPRSHTASSANSDTRRRDAREIFDEYGVRRPDGWLSEASFSGRSDTGVPLSSQTLQACHACGHKSLSTQECPACGHDPCLKCTDQLPFGISKGSGSPQGVKLASFDPADIDRKATYPRGHPNRPTTETEVDVLPLGRSESGSTPRASLADAPLVSMSQPVRSEGGDGLRRENDKVGLGSSNTKASNPVVQADRNAKALPPQISPEHAQAPRTAHISDCVPSRYEERQDQSQSVLEVVPGHHGQEPPTNESASGNVGLSTQSRAPQQLASRPLNQDRESSQRDPKRRHLPPEGPLGQKIDQLYHHSEDLNNSKHIAEHLAAGTRDMQDNSSTSHQGRDPNSQGHRIKTRGSPDSRLHLIDVDETNETRQPEALHDLEIDPRLSVSVDSARTHSLNMDRVGDEHRLSRRSLLDDSNLNEQSPKSPAVSEKMLTNGQAWNLNDPQVSINITAQAPTRNDSHDKQAELRPAPLRASPTNLRPASPEAWLDRPDKIAESSKESARRVAAKTNPHFAPSSTPRLQSQSRRVRDKADQAQGIESQGSRPDRDNKMYNTFTQDKSHLTQFEGEPQGGTQFRQSDRSFLEKADSGEPQEGTLLRQSDRSSLEKADSGHATVAPRGQQASRKVPGESSAHHRKLPQPESAQSKQQLRKVEPTQTLESATAPSATATRRPSLRKVPGLQEIGSSSDTHCGHCNPSQANSSPRESVAGPYLVLEGDDGVAGAKYLVTSKNHKSRGQASALQQGGQSFTTPSRRGPRDLEQSQARQRAGDGMMAQSHQDDKEMPQSGFQSQDGGYLHQESELAKLHNPQPLLDSRHANELRARCIDLSSEIERLKSELGSQNMVARHIDGDRQVDDIVRDGLAWKNYGKLGIEGVTIVLHMRGKDDVVINTDLGRGPAYGLKEGYSERT